jgi:hypothetical protein
LSLGNVLLIVCTEPNITIVSSDEEDEPIENEAGGAAKSVFPFDVASTVILMPMIEKPVPKSNMPGGNKFAGSHRWPPVDTGGCWWTLFVTVSR